MAAKLNFKQSHNKYETSWVFGALKARTMEMDGNLTSSQYLEKLDGYLLSCLKSLAENTRYLDVVVTGLIGWQEENYRRRVSLLSKRTFVDRALVWLISTRKEKVKNVDTLRLDRGVALIICVTFLDACKDYVPLLSMVKIEEQAHLKILSETERRFLVPGGDLRKAVETIRHQSTLAAEYRGKILNKYIRLAIMAAQRDYMDYFDCRISLNDMCGEYLLASARAIDKCDYEKGPLTTHIKNWFFTARKHCANRYDTSRFELEILEENSAGTYGNSIAFEDSELTTEAIDTGLMKLETSETIRFLAKLADPSGEARKALGIEEILNIQEKRLLGIKNF
jgi:hypothetical protein